MQFEQYIESTVKSRLRTIYDPEVPLDIVSLGLIRQVSVDKGMTCTVTYTLTAPNCPAAELLPQQIQDVCNATEGIHHTVLELTFDPPWNPDCISEEGRYQLGII